MPITWEDWLDPPGAPPSGPPESPQPDPTTNRFQNRANGAVMKRGHPFVSSLKGHDAFRWFINPGIDIFRNPIITGIYEEPSLYFPSLLSCQGDSFTSQPQGVLTYKWDRGDGDWIPGATNKTYQTQAADVGLALRCNIQVTNDIETASKYSNQIVIEDVEELTVFDLDGYLIQGMVDHRQITMFDAHVYLLTGITNPKDIAIVEAEIYAITGVANPKDLSQLEAETYVVELLP